MNPTIIETSTPADKLIVEITRAVRDGMPYAIGEILKGFVQVGNLDTARDLLEAWK